MDLPINDDELSYIVTALRDDNPDGPYKKILREQHGMVI